MQKRQNTDRAEISAPEFQYQNANPLWSIRAEQIKHGDDQTGNKKYAMNHQQTFHPFVRFLSRVDRQPRKKRGQRH